MLIRYRSIAGDFWPAVIVARRDNGTVDIDVHGMSRPPQTVLTLTRVSVYHGVAAKCPGGTCIITKDETDGESRDKTKSG